MATKAVSERKRTTPTRVRIGLKGLVTDVSEEFLEAHAIDLKNVMVAPDGSHLIAPMGGRTVTHHVVPQGTVRSLDEYYTTIYRCDPTPFGTGGMLLAALDDTDEVIDIVYFRPEEVWLSLVPLPDIQGPQINVINPLAGDTIWTKDTVTITWSESGTTPPGASKVYIYLMDSSHDRAVDITGGTATTNDGAYSWQVPRLDDNSVALNGTYYIKIVAEHNEYYFANSGQFTIRQAAITVLSPNAIGTQVVEGDDLWVTWSSYGSGIASTVKIELRETSPDQLIATIAASNANSEGINYKMYTIPILGTYGETDYYIRVTDTTDANITDDGAEFKINNAGVTVTPAITLTNPDLNTDNYQGEPLSGLFILGHALYGYVDISWFSEGDIGDEIEIIIFKVNGSKEIRTTVASTQITYRWHLPNEGDAGAEEYAGKWKVTVKPVDGSADPDTSEYPFLIQTKVTQEIEFKYSEPVSGSTFEQGQPVTIKWGDGGSGGTDNVKIELFQIDPGTIVSGFKDAGVYTIYDPTPNNGTFVWTVPELKTGMWFHPRANKPYWIVITRLITGRPAIWGGPIMFQQPQAGNEAFYPVWDRENKVHAIWKAALHEGANNTPYKAIKWAQTAGIEDASGYVAANGGTTMPTVRELITDRDGHPLVGWMDADDSGVRRPQQTTGSGLNDIQSRGNTQYNGTKPKTYTVTISATGTPDQFDWSDGDGGGATGVAITGGWQTLNNNVQIMFAATTGHTQSDVFTIYAINAFPLTRVGDTCRLKKYDRLGQDEIWAADCAAAVRTLESAADEVVIYEHMAIATNDDREVFVAMAGYTRTGANYARRLWAQRIGSDGTINETVGQNTYEGGAAAPTDPTHMGLCAVYGACWSPDGNWWVVYDHKTAEDGSAAYEPTEFTGKVRRFGNSNLTDTTVFAPKPQNATWAVFLGISYQEGGELVMPAFWRYDPGGVDERRCGLVVLTMNGVMRWCAGAGYNTSGSQRKAYPHPGGGCGFERNGPDIGVFNISNQASTIPGAINKLDGFWLSAGDYLWFFDRETIRKQARKVNAGGTLGQGTNHTFNAHALARTSGGEIAYLSIENKDPTFSQTHGLFRISIAEPTTGARRAGIVSEHDSGSPTNKPTLPQPWLWFGGPDANGYNTELDHQDLPWAMLALNAGKRPETEGEEA